MNAQDTGLSHVGQAADQATNEPESKYPVKSCRVYEMSQMFSEGVVLWRHSNDNNDTMLEPIPPKPSERHNPCYFRSKILVHGRNVTDPVVRLANYEGIVVFIEGEKVPDRWTHLVVTACRFHNGKIIEHRTDDGKRSLKKTNPGGFVFARFGDPLDWGEYVTFRARMRDFVCDPNFDWKDFERVIDVTVDEVPLSLPHGLKRLVAQRDWSQAVETYNYVHLVY